MNPTLSTREACGITLMNMGNQENIVVLNADLSGSTQTSKFANKYPNRFFNVGCAEQNLVGTAAGFAISGKTVFAGTFAMFLMRAWEQIRNTVAHDNLNVKLLGSHSGLTDGKDGGSHQCLEDIALMRCLPNMNILIPVDAIETEQLIANEVSRRGPSYIRLNRLSTPTINNDDYKFKFGKSVKLCDGEDITIIATGTMISKALEASKILKTKHINACVINVHTIKPIDENTIIRSAKDTGHVITVEEHNIYGGMGSAITEIISENYPVPMKIMGINDRFGESGDYDHLLKLVGLTTNDIVNNAKKLITYW